MDEYDIYPNLRDGKRMAKADKIETIVMTVLIILLAALLFCKYFVFETVIVSGPSMQNTLQSDDVLLIKKGQDYDYGDIIVHLFRKEERDYFALERLWNNGRNLSEH